MAVHITPFTVVLNPGDDQSCIIRTDAPEKFLKITVPGHPLRGIGTTADLKKRLPDLNRSDLALLTDCGFISDQPLSARESFAQTHSCAPTNALSVTLVVTPACNFNCTYCDQALPFKTPMADTDYAAVEACIQNAVAEQKIHHINLNFFGGEPTLESSAILKFTRRISTLCSHAGTDLFPGITTNGFLLGRDDLAARLCRNGILDYQITLDGPEALHDRLRQGLNGEKTHAAILQGLLALKAQRQEGLKVTIRCNHTTKSIQPRHLDAFHDDLARHFAEDPRFRIYHHAAADLGGTIDRSALLPDKQKRGLMSRLNLESLERGLFVKTDTTSPGGRVCYAADKNAFVFAPGGRVLKCTAALAHPKNQVGSLHTDGTVVLNQNAGLWTRPPAAHSKCRNCRVLPVCQGRSCPLKQIITGRPACPDIKHDPQLFLLTHRSDMLMDQIMQQNQNPAPAGAAL